METGDRRCPECGGQFSHYPGCRLEEDRLILEYEKILRTCGVTDETLRDIQEQVAWRFPSLEDLIGKESTE